MQYAPNVHIYLVSKPPRASIFRKARTDVTLCPQRTTFSAESPIVAESRGEAANSSRIYPASRWPRNRRPSPIPFRRRRGGTSALSIPRNFVPKIPNLGQDVGFGAPKNIINVGSPKDKEGTEIKRRGLTSKSHGFHGCIRIQYVFLPGATKCRRRILQAIGWRLKFPDPVST